MVGIETLVVADHPSRLPGEVIHAEGGPGGHTDDAVKMDAGSVKNVQHACGVHSPHGAAFQNKTGFHR